MRATGRIGSARLQGSGFTSQRRRSQMVQTLRAKGINNAEVLEIMRRVPRHLFVDEAISTRSYDDTALPIGCGQTISQPFVVARMTSIVAEHRSAQGRPQKILELGTGSGYQAAVLSMLCETLVTVECVKELFMRARTSLRDLEYYNVHCHQARVGQWGWPAKGPYDAIVITAATEHIPETLFEQLAPGGLLLAPVGIIDGHQRLQAHVLAETPDGERRISEFETVRFVPLVS